MSIHSHSSLSTETSEASSTRRFGQHRGSDEHSLNQEGPFDWDEEPSFSSAHYLTSTPLKPTRARHIATPAPEADDGEGEEELLRASDTESLEGQEGDSGIKTATRLRLTRRSLSHLTSATNSQTNNPSRPFAASSPSSAATPRPGDDVHLSAPFGSSTRHRYAPTPSTGSSTLVERDEVAPKFSRTAKGKGREDLTIRADRNISTLEEERLEEDDGSSSSPRPLRSKAARRQGELSSYIESKTAAVSTPPPSTRLTRSNNPSTPLAPGAYPPTARKPLSRRSPPSTTTYNTPSSSHDPQPLPSGSKQVHDAFRRFITGPDGALTHSAERRAAAAAAALNAPSSIRRPPHDREPPTPHPAGYYGFSPSTSLPVDSAKDRRRTREALPSSEHRRRREVTWQEDVAGGVGGDEEEEDEQAARAGDSPSNRASTRAAGPSRLERTLRHMSQLQRETEGRSAEPSPLLGDEPQSTAEVTGGMEGRRKQSGRSPRARTRDYEGDYSSASEDSDDSAPRQAQRSAIDFAMARSFAASDDEERSEEEAEAAPVTASARSPSRRSPFRPPTPPSPTLPDLPPTPSPQSSPSKPRLPVRRSPIASRAQPASPPRALPPPQLAVSPPRTSRLRQPSNELIPTSSTPPRRHVAPPAPQGTPLVAPFSRAKVLSASLNAPRAAPVPTPRRRAASLSPSRSPGSLAIPLPDFQAPDGQEQQEGDDSLPAIVAELAVAVRALSKSSGAGLRGDGLPSSDQRVGTSLSGVLARRKKESDGRRRGLEHELDVLEREADGESANRNDVLDRLSQAQEIETALGDRIEELLRGLEHIGQAVGDQVVNVVQESLHLEARQRNSWYAAAFCLQLFVFWIAIRIANARGSDLYETVYYDPFSPSLFHLSSSAQLGVPSVLPQTLELFGSRGGDGLGVVKNWLGDTLRHVAGWGIEAPRVPS